MLAVMALLSSGCGQRAPGPSTTSTTVTAAATTTAPTTTAPTTTAPEPSAAEALAGFFTAATRANAQLEHAAALTNDGIRTTRIVIDPQTVAAVRAIDTAAVARAIPGGLPSPLLSSALEVYADLSSRAAAVQVVVNDAWLSPLPRNGVEGRELLRCLGNGAPAAGWFDGDLAATRALALATPPVTPAPARSPAAAEVAILAHTLDGPNTCSQECGGVVPRPVVLAPIVWKHVVLAGISWDGTVGTSMFSARFVDGQGWVVSTNAC